MARRVGLCAVVCGMWAAPVWALCTGASPTWNSTPDYASVASCVQAAARGDTIHVTAGDGTETWPSTLNLTRGVALIGPGRSLLTVTVANTGLSISPDATAIANEETIKVSGFTFDGNNASSVIVDIDGAGPLSSKPFKRLVLIDNRFKNPSQSSSTVIYQRGQVRGVVANNLFERPMILLRCFGNDDKIEHSNGNFPLSYGTSDNLYYEDNTISWPTAGGAGGFAGWVECGQGGRIAMRYNTWAMQGAAGQDELWDVHGFQNWPNGQTGTMVVEYYGNTVTNKAGYRTLFHRGGWGLYHNNIMTGTSGSGSDVANHNAGCADDVDPTWVSPFGQTENVYWWNFSNNGANVDLAVYPNASNYNNDCPPLENMHWWKYNPSCTASACTAGIGRGMTAPTGSCTPGTGYWVASTPTPTASPSVIQNGVLYRCDAMSQWAVYYTPYTYPHPLRGGAGDMFGPAAPTALTVQ